MNIAFDIIISRKIYGEVFIDDILGMNNSGKMIKIKLINYAHFVNEKSKGVLIKA